MNACWNKKKNSEGIGKKLRCFLIYIIGLINETWSSTWQKTISSLTHWGRVTHICVGNLTIIGSDNGLSPGRRQVITWTNDGLLLIGPLGKNFSEILFGIQMFSFKKMHFKMSSAKWRPFCFGLNALTQWGRDKMAAIFQTTFSNAFSWMKMYKFQLRFHWSMFPRVQLTMFQHWFR